MNIGLWVAQGVLALAFMMSGGLKVFSQEKFKKMGERHPGDPGLPAGLVTFIGVSEIAGAFGLILPMATGIMLPLTSIAAAALALVMLLAIGYHLQQRDPLAKAAAPVVLLALSVFVAYGRGIYLLHSA